MDRIYIESKPVAFLGIESGYEHLYLVYDNGSKETVIRGGPENDNPFNFGAIAIEAGVPIEDSEDSRGDLTKKTAKKSRNRPNQ